MNKNSTEVVLRCLCALLAGRDADAEATLSNACFAPWRMQGAALLEHIRHLKPALGHIPLQNLRPEQVQHYYNEKVQQELDATTIRLHHVTLVQALTLAEKHHLVARN